MVNSRQVVLKDARRASDPAYAIRPLRQRAGASIYGARPKTESAKPIFSQDISSAYCDSCNPVSHESLSPSLNPFVFPHRPKPLANNQPMKTQFV